MVVTLEVDAMEGVAFRYVNRFPTLKIVFLSNRDVDKRSTNALTLRSICAYPLDVEVVVINALLCVIVSLESIAFFVTLYPRHQGVGRLVSSQPLRRADVVVCLRCSQ